MRGVAMVVAAVMVLGATGCGSMAKYGARSVVDDDKVSVINAAARQRGVEVIWVNPPRKTVDKTADNRSK